MVVEQEILPLYRWLLDAPFFGSPDGRWGVAWQFTLILLVLAALGLLLGFLRNLLQLGRDPIESMGGALIGGVRGLGELFHASASRIYAIAWLSFQESIRNRAVAAFVVFVVILLGLGWYLDVESAHPARLYLSTVLFLSNVLLLVLAAFLSVFSLPTDIEERTIYTVVTKPVYSAEIVFGRILGFGAVGTLLLLLMGATNYVFVIRGLDHSHEVEAEHVQREMLYESPNPDSPLLARDEQRQFTTRDQYHRHTFTLDESGKGRTDTVREHYHTVTRDGDRVIIGPPEGQLQARVPVYGQLRFLGRDGKPSDQGINVGYEWGYRGYIEGGTLGAAIWTYDIREDQFPEGLPVELTLRVFRTHKGDIERGILGSIQLRNPNPASPARSQPRNFTAKEMTVDQIFLPRKMSGTRGDGTTGEIDIFEDLVHEGQIQLEVRCVERAQYYGASRADVYLRATEAPFFVNYLKGHVSIWNQMMIVTAFGVMFSTFLSAPVALLAVSAAWTLGYFKTFIVGMATGELKGGGPIEAAIRTFEQKNVIQPLDDRTGYSLVWGIDLVMRGIMWCIAMVVPSFREMGAGNYVAYGYDIPVDLILQHFLTGLAYTFVAACIGYLFLRGREIAA